MGNEKDAKAALDRLAKKAAETKAQQLSKRAAEEAWKAAKRK
jgi:hypothetical protein